MMGNEPDITGALTNASREIAIAKLSEFDWQCHYIGGMVRTNPDVKAQAADALYGAAIANGLVRTHGEDKIADIMADGFGGAI